MEVGRYRFILKYEDIFRPLCFICILLFILLPNLLTATTQVLHDFFSIFLRLFTAMLCRKHNSNFTDVKNHDT